MGNAVIALGSNIPPRRRYLQRALERIGALADSKVLNRSRIYETAPVGGPPQGPYLNAAVKIRTGFAPLELLDRLQAIEMDLGRAQNEPNGPRTVDLDIIFYGKIVLDDPRLRLPHPRFRERGFVLFPLNDIIPRGLDPETGRSVSALLDAWLDAWKEGTFVRPQPSGRL